MSKLNCIFNLAQMKIMADKDSTFFDKSHTKDDIFVKAWLNHVIVAKSDGRVLIYEFTGRRFKPTAFTQKAKCVEDAEEIIEKEGGYSAEEHGYPRRPGGLWVDKLASGEKERDRS